MVSMPWRVEERKGKFAVVEQDTGETVATHDSKEEAKAQVRALYANAPKRHTRG